MKKSLALLFVFSFIILLLGVATVATAATPITVTVRGTIYDNNHNPLPGATVTLINDNSLGPVYESLGTTTSGSDGTFSFSNKLTTSNNIKVVISYTSGGQTFKSTYGDFSWEDVSSGYKIMDEKDTTLYYYPAPAYGKLYGYVNYPNNAPVPNAVVFVTSAGVEKYYAFADKGGQFSMNVPVGQFQIYAIGKSGGLCYQSDTVSVKIEGDTSSTAINTAVTIVVPSTNPKPVTVPGTYANTLNGTVTYLDGKGVPGAVVSLWEASDYSNGGYLKVADKQTDSNGFYQFPNVQVTSDDGRVVSALKYFYVSASFTDSKGNLHIQNTSSFQIYNPNVILGIGGAEQGARNMTQNIGFNYTTSGWINIISDPPGAKVYVDGKPLTFPNGTQYVTPCYPAYVPAGKHTIRLTDDADGYNPKDIPNVNIAENRQTADINAQLSQSVVTGWMITAVAVIILLIVVVVIAAVAWPRRNMILDPLSDKLGNMRSAGADRRANREAARTRAAEMRRSEQAHRAQVREPPSASYQKLDGRRRGDYDQSFGAVAEQPRLPEHTEEDLSMVSARDIYGKPENPDVERIPHTNSGGNAARSRGPGSRNPPAQEPYDSYGHDAPRSMDPPRARSDPRTSDPRSAREMPARNLPAATDSDGRIRVPRTSPPARGSVPESSVRDKERVIKYIHDHQDGVSFIQMSNELEIPPNTLTIITKELVINDDIEKVKGLYYYKSHDSSQDDSKSSVVVWRLDGEE